MNKRTLLVIKITCCIVFVFQNSEFAFKNRAYKNSFRCCFCLMATRVFSGVLRDQSLVIMIKSFWPYPSTFRSWNALSECFSSLEQPGSSAVSLVWVLFHLDEFYPSSLDPESVFCAPMVSSEFFFLRPRVSGSFPSSSWTKRLSSECF